MKKIAACVLVIFLLSCNFLDPDEPGNLVRKTVDEDASLPSISINNTKLHLETFGDPANTVAIFLHGGPGGDYRGLLRLKPLQDSYFCVFFDQRGAGLSRRHDAADINITNYIRDLDAIIERFSPGRKVFLIGWSWGAQYASAYISKHPSKVRGAVLLGPGPFTQDIADTVETIQIDLNAIWLNNYIWNNEFISQDSHVRMDYSAALGIKDTAPGYNMSETDFMKTWRFGAVVLYTFEVATDKNYTTGLSAYTGNALFMRGGLNSIFSDAYVRNEMRFYNNTQLITIAGAGHDFIWVKANETLAGIRPFLAAN